MIDARGLSCPLPVIKTKQAIEKEHPDALEVLVDNATAKENVSRFAAHAGYRVTVKELEDEEYSLKLEKL